METLTRRVRPGGNPHLLLIKLNPQEQSVEFRQNTLEGTALKYYPKIPRVSETTAFLMGETMISVHKCTGMGNI